VGHCLEDPGGQPPLRLLVDGLPGWEVVGQHPPGGAGPHDPPQGVEDLAQVVGALGRVSADQGEVGGDEGPLLVGNVAWVRFSCSYARMLALQPKVHNTL
jgi:hypothetical protein